MVLWWAAFFIVGLISPPSPLCEVLASCLAAGIPAIFFSIVSRRRHGFFRFPEHSPGGAAAVRYVSAVAACIILWECGGIEGRAFTAGCFATGTPRYSYGRADGVGGAKAASLETEEASSQSILPGIARLRSYLIASLDDGRLDRSGKGITGALVLDYRKDLGFALNETYSYLGITHLLALSGMHLAVIAVPLAKLLSLVLPSRNRRDAVLLAILCLYAAVANFPPSLSRALALLAAVIGYRLIGLNSGLLTALVGGCFVLGAFEPAVVFDAGFQLSFAAVCGIALIGIPLSRMAEAAVPGGFRGTLIKTLLFPALITCSVQFLTMPLTIVLFKRASLISPVVNVIVSLPFTALLYLGVVYVFVPFGPLRVVLAVPTNLICRFLDVVPLAFSRAPHPAIYFGDFNFAIYLAGAGLVAYFFERRPLERLHCLLAGAFFVALSFVAHGAPLEQRAYAAVSGKAGGAAVRLEDETLAGSTIVKPGALYLSRGGGLLVVDERFSTHDSYRLTRELWARGVRKVELCIVAAPRLKPRHGIFYFVKRVSVGEIVCSPYLPLAHGRFEADMRRVGARVSTAMRGDTVRTGSFEVVIVGPLFPPPGGASLPADSLRLRCRIFERPRLTSIPAANNMLAVH